MTVAHDTVPLPNVKSVQDMPPPGNYPNKPAVRRRMQRGPAGAVIFGALVGFFIYGMYTRSVTNEEKRHNHKVNRECRMAIVPFLMAEKDLGSVESHKLNALLVAEIMKDVPDFKPTQSPYFKRWMKPLPETRDAGKIDK